jgi:hypothetical protein
LKLPAISGFAALLLLTLFGTVPAKSQADPSGIWLTQAGDARVQVSRCGGGLCGKIVWLRDPIDPRTGQPQVDDKNANPALTQRPIMGLSLFSACGKSVETSGPGAFTTPTTARPTPPT